MDLFDVVLSVGILLSRPTGYFLPLYNNAVPSSEATGSPSPLGIVLILISIACV